MPNIIKPLGGLTTSAQLAAAITDETGTGYVVFSDSPVFTTQISTPKIISASGNLNIVSASGLTMVGDGDAAKTVSLKVNGGTNAGKGTVFTLAKGSTQIFAISDEAAITGSGTSSTPCFFSETGLGMKFFVDGDIPAAKTLFLTSTMKLGIAVNPTARLHLPAGTTVQYTAPLQFTAGDPETTPRAGLMEYNGRFIVTESDTTNRYLVQAASSTKTTAGAPYTNDGYVTMTVNGTALKVMTTA